MTPPFGIEEQAKAASFYIRPYLGTTDVGVAVIKRENGDVLIDRRKKISVLGGLWEFPGGKLEAGETI